MSNNRLHFKSQAFLDHLDGWMENLSSLNLAELAIDPDKCAVLSVDLTNGFCYEGALSSPRVAGIVEPIVSLFERAWESNIKHMVLINDTHEEDALEFSAFPPHCVRGTVEAESVDKIKQLPFNHQMLIFEKNSITVGKHPEFEKWLSENPQIDTFIIVGDCTDICVYQLAMYLQTDANERHLERKVIVPVDCVNTYDMPVNVAQEVGAMAHTGDLFHAMFLYHMALNGVQIVSHIE